MEYSSKMHSKYCGIKGFIRIYGISINYSMLTEKAKHKARVLSFWERYGLDATIEAFKVKKRTLYLWKKQLKKGKGELKSLNEKSKRPLNLRKREWPDLIKDEIKRLRLEHPNIGKDKLYTLIARFCLKQDIKYPSVSTIGRLIRDMGGLRLYPKKVSHFGKIKKINRRKVLRKPKDFRAEKVGHLVALDTIERFVNGCRRYVITFEDIYSRFAFAWSTTSHASLAAKEFFEYCQMVFPYKIEFVLTDNGSEFKKHFSVKLNELYLTHYHTYPRTPTMNSHCERFNRTIQEEFIDFHAYELINTTMFNKKLIEWLIWYNTERPHFAFQNKRSPLQFIMSLLPEEKCNMYWTHTFP